MFRNTRRLLPVSLLGLLLLITVYALALSAGGAASKEPLWVLEEPVVDVAISADGSTVAIATSSSVKVYSIHGTMLWSWSPPSTFHPTAVDVSDDGNAVAAAIYSSSALEGYVVFWGNAKGLSGSPDPAWNSTNLYGPIGVDALAVSGDGNHVVAVGTGPNIFYWNNTLSLSGPYVATTWEYAVGPSLEHVDISYDGSVVVTGGYRGPLPPGYVDIYLYKDATTLSGWVGPTKTWSFAGYGALRGVALSKQGEYLAIAAHTTTVGFLISMINTVSEEILWNYTSPGNFVADVDLSSDGGTAVAATFVGGGSPENILVFRNANSPRGALAEPDMTIYGFDTYTWRDFTDIAISGDGRVAVAGTGDIVFAADLSTGDIMWYYNGTYPSVSQVVDISEDGKFAVTGGGAVDSAYIFRVPPAATVGGELEFAQTPSRDSRTLLALTTIMLAAISLALRGYKKQRSATR